jgi:anti-sigma B factor antagonist
VTEGSDTVEIPVDRIGDVSVATVPVEELDADNALAFTQAVAPVLEANSKVVLDPSRMWFLDSSGLGAFLGCLQTMEPRGGELIFCGMAKAVRAVFELVRMHRLLEIHETRDEAVRACQPAA